MPPPTPMAFVFYSLLCVPRPLCVHLCCCWCRYNDSFLSLLSVVMDSLEETLFEVKISKSSRKEPKRRLRPAFAGSALTFPAWQQLRSKLFVRPARDADAPPNPCIVRCGRTLVVTLSARPESDAGDSWDEPQFVGLRDAFQALFRRSQHRQVVALAEAALAAHKLDQVRLVQGWALFSGSASGPIEGVTRQPPSPSLFYGVAVALPCAFALLSNFATPPPAPPVAVFGAVVSVRGLPSFPGGGPQGGARACPRR